MKITKKHALRRLAAAALLLLAGGLTACKREPPAEAQPQAPAAVQVGQVNIATV